MGDSVLLVLWGVLMWFVFGGDAISPLSITGNKFYDATGQQVFFKGVAYQRSPQDPLVNTTQCQLDAQLMQTLGANVIRSYHVDPTGDHDGCMQAFSDAGIYLFLDLDTFTTQIEETAPEWTMSMYANFTEVMETFAKYDNLAGFFVANEVVTNPAGIDASPYVKAAVRDTKAYMLNMVAKGGRYIPIGYSAADIATIRPMFQDYLACGPKSVSIDFFAVNIYEWCGDQTFQTSGYADRVAELEGYPIPAFFSEDGCIAVRPRTFSDMPTIFSSNMTSVLSGAIVYEWTQEVNDYGIIQYPYTTIQNNVVVPVGVPIPMQPEFNNLQSVWAACSPQGTPLAQYTPVTATFACPTETGAWTIDAEAVLPTSPGSLNPPVPAAYSFTGTLSSLSVVTPTIGVTGTSEGGTTAGAGSTSTGTTVTSGGTASVKASSSSSASAGTRIVVRGVVGWGVGFVVFCIGLGCVV